MVYRQHPQILRQALLALVCMGLCAAWAPQKESKPYFQKWLGEDVVYIISPEERDIFLKLRTDEEREQFLEQFWKRRDPTPNTPDNEFKEEHYRRIQYANEQYHAGISGWRTDRGMIFIKYGKPDRLTSYPTGGPYIRPGREGGGQTWAYPFEVWEYRHLDGIGDDVEIEFVDVSGGNLYKLSVDPQEKDLLLNVPGMGLTDSERLTGDKNFDRVTRIRSAGSARNQGITGERAKDQPFARTELAAKLTMPTPIRFQDLRSVVTAHITYNLLPFDVRWMLTRLSGTQWLVPITVGIKCEEVTFKQEGPDRRSSLNLYARLSTMTGTTAFEFDDEIALSFSVTQWPQAKSQRAIYRKSMVLKPGRYKLEIALKDIASGKVGTLSTGVSVPEIDETRLQVSPVVFAESMDRANPEDPDAFVGSYKVVPRESDSYSREDFMGVYLEVYNFRKDTALGQPQIRIEYIIAPKGATGSGEYRDISKSVTIEEDRILIPRRIHLLRYAPGEYDIRFRITDTVSQQTITASAHFKIS